MAMSISDLSSRLHKLQTEVEIAQRQRATEAFNAVKALSSISPEDVETLKVIVPELQIIVKYTQSDIEANEHEEVQTIRRVTANLQSYLEQRLTFYEEQL